MTKTLKQIDNDILERIKLIHELFMRWSYMTKEEYENKRLSQGFYEETARVRNEIEAELRSIYADVMHEEEVRKHLKELNEAMKKEFE